MVEETTGYKKVPGMECWVGWNKLLTLQNLVEIEVVLLLVLLPGGLDTGGRVKEGAVHVEEDGVDGDRLGRHLF